MKKDGFLQVPKLKLSPPGEECQGSDGVLSAAEREEICQEPTQSVMAVMGWVFFLAFLRRTRGFWKNHGSKVLLVDDSLWDSSTLHMYIYMLLYNIY